MSRLKRALEVIRSGDEPGGAVAPIAPVVPDVPVEDAVEDAANDKANVELLDIAVQPQRIFDVELDTHCLQQLGLWPRNADEEMQFANQARRAAENLVTALDENASATAPGARLVLVTSCGDGAGRVTCSLALAYSLSAIGRHEVLLVDGDTRRAGLTDQLHLSTRTGLSNLVRNPKLTTNDVLLTTSNPKIQLVPAGTDKKISDWSISAEHEYRVLSQLGSDASDRVILVVSPTIETFVDQQLFVSTADAIVLVASSGETSRRAFLETLKKMQAFANVKVLLNKVPVK